MQYSKTALLPVLIFTLLSAIPNNSEAQQPPITVQPEMPAQGEIVTITYHPENKNAAIQSPDSLTLVLSYAPYLYSQPDEFEMTKTSEGWSADIPLSEQFKFASFYIKSGEITDQNSDGHHFEFFAYKDGKPVQGAYLMKANSLEDRYAEMSDNLLANIKAAMYAKELALYPESYKGQINLYAFQLKQENADKSAIRQKAHKVINERLADDPSSFAVISDVKQGFRQIGEKAKGDSLEQSMIEKYPNRDIAMYDFYQKASKQKDEKKQAEMLRKYINADYERSFINKYYTENAYEKLFQYYIKQGDLEKANQMAMNWIEKPLLDNKIKSSSYNSAANTIVEHTNAYDLALNYAQKALELTEEEPAFTSLTSSGRIVRYSNHSNKYKQQRNSEILATIGRVYLEKEDYDQAEKYLSKAKELSDPESARKYMAELYLHTKRPKEAFDTYWNILMEEPTNKEMRKKLKKAYIAYNGSDKGFKTKTKKLDKAWRDKMVEKFNKERIGKEAPSFSGITDLQGNPFDTSKLEDKVVVVDLWATWCGPCMSAFPYLQNIYQEYKDHPNVKFVVLNTSWNNTMKDARKWAKENDYTFPLYFDKESKITEAFGVRGIPSTFFIGKDGNIQFKKVGFEGPTMEKKMKLQIDMLLEDEKAETTSSPQR